MLTYEESAALMMDLAFRGRIKVACLKFSSYILNEPTDTPAHSSRLRWAQSTAQAPDVAAASVQPLVVMEDAVQQEGAAITDQDLQTAVETVVNHII